MTPDSPADVVRAPKRTAAEERRQPRVCSYWWARHAGIACTPRRHPTPPPWRSGTARDPGAVPRRTPGWLSATQQGAPCCTGQFVGCTYRAGTRFNHEYRPPPTSTTKAGGEPMTATGVLPHRHSATTVVCSSEHDCRGSGRGTAAWGRVAPREPPCGRKKTAGGVGVTKCPLQCRRLGEITTPPHATVGTGG